MSVPIRTKTTLRARVEGGTERDGGRHAARVCVAHEGASAATRSDCSSEAIQVDGKRVRVERLTPAGWKLLQTVVVESEGYGSRAEKDKLRFKVPKGTTIRAVLPRSQTGPCLPRRLQQPHPDMRRLAVLRSYSVAGVALAGVAAAGILADSVTLQPRATVLRTNEFSVGVLGAISSGAEGEYVAVHGKECGIPGAFFRGLGGATTLRGRTVRGVASRCVRRRRCAQSGRTPQSATVVVTPRANVRLTKEPDGFRVSLTNDTASADGKRVTIERFTGRAGRSSRPSSSRRARLRPVRGEEEAPLQGAEGHDDPRGAPALAGGRLLPGRIQQAHANVEEAK